MSRLPEGKPEPATQLLKGGDSNRQQEGGAVLAG